jgi:hypothetical protein
MLPIESHLMPYFPIADPPCIIPIFAGQEKLGIKTHYAIVMLKPHNPSLSATFSPFCSNQVKGQTQWVKKPEISELVQHRYPSQTSKLNVTE